MPLIGYNLNIPFATNNPSTDQPNMLQNTNAINTWNAVDHFTFGSALGGTHKQVSLLNEAAPGIPAGSSGVLYANVDTGQSWPFWQNALGSFHLMGPQSLGTNGYTWVGGILVQWGFVQGTHGSAPSHFNGGDAGSVLFATVPNIAFPNNLFNVWTAAYYQQGSGSSGRPGSQATIAISDGNGVGGLFDKTGFKWVFVTNSSDYTFFSWLAIGN